MINGLKGIVDIHRYVNRIRSCTGRQTLMMQRFLDTVPLEPDNEHGQQLVFNVNKVVSCLPVHCRLGCYSFLMMKAATLLWLITYGSAYILHSAGDEALILNSVALCFVVDVDTYIYDFVANGTIKVWLSSMPAVGLTTTEIKGSALVTLDEHWPLLSVVVLSAVTAMCYTSWCQAPLGL